MKSEIEIRNKWTKKKKELLNYIWNIKVVLHYSDITSLLHFFSSCFYFTYLLIFDFQHYWKLSCNKWEAFHKKNLFSDVTFTLTTSCLPFKSLLKNQYHHFCTEVISFIFDILRSQTKNKCNHSNQLEVR